MQWHPHDVTYFDIDTLGNRVVKDAIDSTDIGNDRNDLHANPSRRPGRPYFSFKALEKSSNLLNFSQVNAESVRPKWP